MSLTAACVPEVFSPIVFGSEILTLQASPVTNYSARVPSAYRFTQPSISVENATFCNITVTYTHPGQNDTINVEAWLPVDNWNGRFQAVGGGGWVAGRFFLSYSAMAGAMGDGYATITTDAGLGNATDPSPWALLSPGNVDLYKLQDLASVSLNDEAIIGKSLIQSFYGKPPSYSYWNGCSQGGRQGLMLAQRYPTAYDGIAAGAPAIYWSELVFTTFWTQQYMAMINEYPYGCEIDAITAAAIAKCDGFDGVVDGIVADVEECAANFDPFDLIGKVIDCAQTNTTMQISAAAAKVANATWEGIVSTTGRRLWHGLNLDADLTGDSSSSFNPTGLAATKCSNGTCVPVANNLGSLWLQLFVEKQPDFDLSNISHQKFVDMLHDSKQQYDSITATSDPDLSTFKRAGGKLLTFHGLADNIITPKSTEQYYREVSERFLDVRDFYRHYPVPGLGHCFGGTGGQPLSLFDQLRAWVENGTAPESSPMSFPGPNGKVQQRILCPLPQKAKYDSGCRDPAKVECWSCIAPRNEDSSPVTEL
ncbi:tannase and feruloyl esterase [Lindgomyces ingoldianus]|uniref:Tannase and feruloyl esterase n=1 Tax=Lindgomyces ingoldianus TaxID=673940 RepID=A0ACB6QXU4_9PLEO|nr:tannase and feruloyl esterase [Lindgomyces ingoldianus]KAF2470902.1 tannase and feruloyl esterase [Lindgomyces ingoldianus]